MKMKFLACFAVNHRYHLGILQLICIGDSDMIRQATHRDASRIAEISVFSKRMNYRKIFHNDLFSFGELQVYPLAKEYMDQPDILKDFYVYEDDFVKGFIHIQEAQVVELYVDTFFVDRGIGTELLDFAVHSRDCNSLWVLEKNTKARSFYLRHGFTPSGKKQLENGTEQYIIEMIR